MGHVYVEATVSNPSDPRLRRTANALVDTGATVTVAVALQLPVIGRRKVRKATGDMEVDSSGALIQINGKSEINPIYISDTLDRVLVGAVTLETLALTVNPKTGELKETELLWY